MTTLPTTYETARGYLAAGLSVIPVMPDGTKRPAVKHWKPYQERLATPDELVKWFGDTGLGIAVIGGKVSNGLEVLDFETEQSFLAWSQLLGEIDPDVLATLPQVRTPSGGVHVYYRFEWPSGNTKLARNAAGETLIETRGEGGYVLAPGCPPACHPSGRYYELISGVGIEDVPTLVGVDFRQLMHSLARGLNEFTQPGLHWDKPSSSGANRPGDDFNRRAGWEEILTGWAQVRRVGGVTFWRRPGKEGQCWSATTGHCRNEGGEDLLYVFTSGAPPFEPERTYSRFAAYALIHHGGDYKAAARALGGRGYGTQQTAADRAQAKPAAEPEQAAWEPPIPLDALPQVAAFPLDVLPRPLWRYVEEAAYATNTPPDFTAVPMLSLAGAAIGNTRRLEITRTHLQSACTYTGFIGLPGTGKSNPLMFLQQPFSRREHELYEEWKRDKELYEIRDTAERSGGPPKLKRCQLDDATAEVVVKILAENLRGCVMIRDELSAFADGMNQYKANGKGADQQLYLKIWSHARVTVDRKNLDGVPLTVRNPFLSIVGGLQPDTLQGLRGEGDVGRFDRFLLCWPEVLPAVGERWLNLSEESEEAWSEVIGNLFRLRMVNHNGDEIPKRVTFSQDAKDVWTLETHRHADEINDPAFLQHLRGPWAKLTAYAGRLSLILQMLWEQPQHEEHRQEFIDGETVERAWRLVDYFKSHTKKATVCMGGDPRVEEARKVLNWINRNRDKQTFSRRDLYRDLGNSFSKPEALENPLRLLCEHGLIAPLPDESRTTGRKPTQRYAANPLIAPQN